MPTNITIGDGLPTTRTASPPPSATVTLLRHWRQADTAELPQIVLRDGFPSASHGLQLTDLPCHFAVEEAIVLGWETEWHH